MAGKARGRKSIFITGAASGMGRETAKLFAGKGWFVGAYDVNTDGLKTLEQEIGADNCMTRHARCDAASRISMRPSPHSVRRRTARWTCSSAMPASAKAAGSKTFLTKPRCASYRSISSA